MLRPNDFHPGTERRGNRQTAILACGWEKWNDKQAGEREEGKKHRERPSQRVQTGEGRVRVLIVKNYWWEWDSCRQEGRRAGRKSSQKSRKQASG